MTVANIISIAVTAVGIIMLIAGAILCFLPKRYAVVPAYAGLLGIGLIVPYHTVPALIFWAVAAIITLAIGYMLPESVATSRRGVGYIAGAVIAGTFAGMAVSNAWMITGAVAGAILGGMAYSKTPAGRTMGFPSSKFFNYLCAKGLPAVVTACIIGTAVMWLTATISK